MLTYKKNFNYSAFFWNDECLDEIKSYEATVLWPDGTQEILDFVIEQRFEGYDDFPCHSGFLVVNHNAFEGFLEILFNEPKSLNLIKDLKIKV